MDGDKRLLELVKEAQRLIEILTVWAREDGLEMTERWADDWLQRAKGELDEQANH